MSRLSKKDRSMSWDKFVAVHYLQSHARSSSQGNCARYVREAIERGGIVLNRAASARNYGSSLVGAGFHEVSSSSPQRGDVVVIESIPRHPDGHTAMYDGQIWISDFRQLHGLYPGKEYRDARPLYKMYRHDRGAQ
jgi:hypothetical protein